MSDTSPARRGSSPAPQERDTRTGVRATVEPRRDTAEVVRETREKR
jgi:hypothetical protein